MRKYLPLLVLFFFSCSKDDGSVNPQTKSWPKELIPLTTGNSWIYLGDSYGPGSNTPLSSHTDTALIIADSIKGMHHVYYFESHELQTNQVWQVDTGLCGYFGEVDGDQMIYRYPPDVSLTDRPYIYNVTARNTDTTINLRNGQSYQCIFYKFVQYRHEIFDTTIIRQIYDFICPGIGLIKTVYYANTSYSGSGTMYLSSIHELKSYQLK